MKYPYHIRHDEGATSSSAQNTGNYYQSCPFGIDDGRRGMTSVEKAWSNTALDVHTAVQRVNDSGTTKKSRDVTEVAEILMRHAKIDHWAAAWQLVYMLHDLTIDLDILQSISKYLNKCETATSKRTKEILEMIVFKGSTWEMKEEAMKITVVFTWRLCVTFFKNSPSSAKKNRISHSIQSGRNVYRK